MLIKNRAISSTTGLRRHCGYLTVCTDANILPGNVLHRTQYRDIRASVQKSKLVSYFIVKSEINIIFLFCILARDEILAQKE